MAALNNYFVMYVYWQLHGNTVLWRCCVSSRSILKLSIGVRSEFVMGPERQFFVFSE